MSSIALTKAQDKAGLSQPMRLFSPFEDKVEEKREEKDDFDPINVFRPAATRSVLDEIALKPASQIGKKAGQSTISDSEDGFSPK